MYTLAVADSTTLLGYKLWNGFEDSGTSYRLKDIDVQSFEREELSAYLRVLPSMAYAVREATRINGIIAERCIKKVEVFAMPLSVLSRQMELLTRR